jgi:hypothetical protein
MIRYQSYLFLAFFVLMMGCSLLQRKVVIDLHTSGHMQLTHKISFNKSKVAMPRNCIICDDYLDKTNNLFFINQPYLEQYSQIVEYNILTNSVVNEIMKLDEKEGVIQGYDYDTEFIVWDVIKKDKDSSLKDIYVYNINTKKINKIAENIICDYPLSLKVNNGKVVWIEHDDIKKLSKIKIYNLYTNIEQTIVSLDYISKTFTSFKNSIISLELKDNKLFYDRRYDDAPSKIIVYDINKNEQVEELDTRNDISFNYDIAYSSENNYLTIYGNNIKKDIIYVLDITNKKVNNILEFYPRTVVYNDRMKLIEDNLFYTVQINVSGKIADHYYAEIYDIHNKTMKDYKHAIDIQKTNKYFSILKYDKKEEINKINFELYKKI